MTRECARCKAMIEGEMPRYWAVYHGNRVIICLTCRAYLQRKQSHRALELSGMGSESRRFGSAPRLPLRTRALQAVVGVCLGFGVSLAAWKALGLFDGRVAIAAAVLCGGAAWLNVGEKR